MFSLLCILIWKGCIPTGQNNKSKDANCNWSVPVRKGSGQEGPRVQRRGRNRLAEGQHGNIHQDHLPGGAGHRTEVTQRRSVNLLTHLPKGQFRLHYKSAATWDRRLQFCMEIGKFLRLRCCSSLQIRSNMWLVWTSLKVFFESVIYRWTRRHNFATAGVRRVSVMTESERTLQS